EIRSRLPKTWNKYIEPFIGGGAVFFALQPERAVIADINKELINLYQAIATDLNGVISWLELYRNTEEDFYEARAQDWTKMSPARAAARTIFLNKTCYNGLYRVNRAGRFNVPFGRYRNPRIVDEPALIAAHKALQNAEIVHGTYRDVLRKHA